MYGTQWYMKVGNMAFNLVLLNLLWLTFTLLGFIVLGLFPATAALFAVIKQMILEDENPAVMKLFFTKFKSEFKAANIVGYLNLGIGVLLFINFKILQQIDNQFLQLILASVTVVISAVYLLGLLYVFPILVHFNMTTWQYMKHSVILAVAKPINTILALLLVAIVVYLYMKFPVLIVIFGVSLLALVTTKVACFSFPRKVTSSVN